MTKKAKTAYIIIALVLTAALTACQQSGLFTDSEGQEGTYVTSHEISIPVMKIRNLNPATSSDEDIYQMTKLVYNSLIGLGDTMEPTAELAESWTYNDSGDLEFRLKKGVRFSDGSELTADDVDFSVDVLKSAGETSAYASKVSNISGVSVHSDYEFTVNLRDSSDTSIADFDFPIFSSSQYSGVREFLSVEDEPLIGSGAYKIDSASGQEIRLSANEHTFEVKPSNTITLKVMPAADLYPGLVSAGELSIMVMDQFNRENIAGNKRLKVTPFTSNEFETLGFHIRESGACASKYVRQAVAMTVDRDEIISSCYYSSSIKSDDLYFPGYLGTETTNDFTSDRETALELLKEAGYSDSDEDGVMEDSEGGELEMKLVTSSENESRRMAAQMIARQLGEIGIRVSITEVASESLISAASSGSYDLFIAGWKVDERFDLRQFYHSGYGNPAGYANTTLDSLLDHMFSGVSAEQMKQDLTDAKKIIADEVPYLCLCYKTYAAVTSADFEGLIVSQFNDYYASCQDWSVRFLQPEEEKAAEDNGGTAQSE